MSDHLDGNMLAGALGELFAVDVTTAVGQCASCGATAVLAQALVYAGGPGLVARCPACTEVVLRVVRGPDRAWLDLRGVTCLQLAVPPAAG
jgi:Family of unknown function (DUF6510)